MSFSTLRRRVVCSGALLMAACGGLPSLPPAPSDLMGGVSIFEHANFLGDSAHLESSRADLKDFNGPCEHIDSDGTNQSFDWNDCVSSIRVANGWRAIIYRDPDYRGQSLEVTADVPNLQLVAGSCSRDGLNDCVTSIKVIAPGQAF